MLDSSIGSTFYNNKNRNNIIEKIIFNKKESRLFVNNSLYFNVPLEVWEYKIGGYQVLDKYLKSHKNEEIDYQHFSRVIQVLHKSLEIEEEISRINISL